MINFVTELPETLEPSSIYYVKGATGNALHYVSDDEGIATPVTTEQLVQGYVNTLKGAANGYAGLDANQKLLAANLPEGSQPTVINAAISTVESSLQTSINQKADSSQVYDKSAVDSIESGLQSQVDTKQAALSNAADVAKLGDATFNGKPFILLNNLEW